MQRRFEVLPEKLFEKGDRVVLTAPVETTGDCGGTLPTGTPGVVGARVQEIGEWVKVEWEGGLNGWQLFSRKEIALTAEERDEKVRDMIDRKLKSLDKQRTKLEKLLKDYE